MGGELLDSKRAHEGYDGFKPQDDTPLCQDTKEEPPAEGVNNLAGVLSATIEHYFPSFNEWLFGLTDTRLQQRIGYSRQTIMWAALLGLVTKRGSRKRITDHMRTERFCENLKSFCGQHDITRTPHADTIEYLFTRTKTDELETLQMMLMRNLFRMRVFEKQRLMNKYHTIAIDGIYVYRFNYKHCQHCLASKDSSGGDIWLHNKLQASLVTPDGLCMPMASEWIENSEDGLYDKQDCERKASYRLFKKLRRLYPRLPICVLLDSLYACAPVFEILKELKMEWIIVFKEGSMPEVYSWVMATKKRIASKNVIVSRDTRDIEARKRRSHTQRLNRRKTNSKKREVTVEGTYTWLNAAKHWDGKRSFNIVTCKEIEGTKTNCDYVWLVSDGLRLCEDNAVELAERGRLRWVIENQGNNMQKNGGYNLGHLYSKDKVSMKIWCAMLDIACIINQLIEKGSLITKKAFGSIRNISERLFEHLTYYVFTKPPIRPLIQIRLGWYNTS
ncbi:MAG: hypothetical protein ABH875_03020 [Candidatus Omnitrophota bacterium]